MTFRIFRPHDIIGIISQTQKELVEYHEKFGADMKTMQKMVNRERADSISLQFDGSVHQVFVSTYFFLFASCYLEKKMIKKGAL